MLDDQLPEGHTARKLAAAMAEVPGVPPRLIKRASVGYYHDYLSPLPFPELTLAADLVRAARDAPEHREALLALRRRVIDGEFDASREESDAWMSSAEGQATIRSLINRE